MISTKGRYAICVMVDLAENSDGRYIPLRDIAARQDISLKYLEKIVPPLTRSGLVECCAGKGGGYRLTRPPEEYGIWEILELTEGDLAPVSCLSCDRKPCSKAEECKILPMWQEYHELKRKYFSGITVADLVGEPHGKMDL